MLRIETREVHHPTDAIQVGRSDVDGPAIGIWLPKTGGETAAVHRCRYPVGTRLSDGPTPFVTGFPWLACPSLDFDADGTFDRVECPGGADCDCVREVSGMDGRTLFEDDHPLEYECKDRAFPLGDMDGDGFAELALVHPRRDRSRYDWELWDRIPGARSWITIVSGREAKR